MSEIPTTADAVLLGAEIDLELCKKKKKNHFLSRCKELPSYGLEPFFLSIAQSLWAAKSFRNVCHSSCSMRLR